MSATGVVVIGASAGGLEAVRAVLGPLPPRFPAAVFVVFHHGARSASALPALLTRAGELPASVPHDGEAVEDGSVYVARPDRHLIVEDGHVRLVFGPRRHGFRPAVDPLFISAARGWNSAAAGVILSGGLDDGSVGLAAIKHARGLALVQDPEEAAVESMPPAAVRDVEVDAVLCAADGDRTATRTRSLRYHSKPRQCILRQLRGVRTPMERRHPLDPPADRLDFPTTHWSVVFTAGDRETPEASAALEQLCRTYWYPLYAYVRRRGFEPADAEDLTQQFFAQLLDGNFVARADPAKGKFRAFLLSGIKYLLSHEREKAGRLKRGGGVPPPISLDQLDAEARYRQEPVDTLTPERVFERTWLATLLEAVGRRLRAEYVTAGKGEIYALLKDCRLDAADQPAYREVAARLGQSVSAVKSAIWRLRRRHEALIREAIAQTLDVDQSVEEEIRYLLEVAGPR